MPICSTDGLTSGLVLRMNRRTESQQAMEQPYPNVLRDLEYAIPKFKEDAAIVNTYMAARFGGRSSIKTYRFVWRHSL